MTYAQTEYFVSCDSCQLRKPCVQPVNTPHGQTSQCHECRYDQPCAKDCHECLWALASGQIETIASPRPVSLMDLTLALAKVAAERAWPRETFTDEKDESGPRVA